jgi:MFS family permease
MTVLVVAGETVFLLPFVVARIFRPTFLDVFNLTNFQLGTAFALYGLVAMASYFLGGPLADRFSARKLMTVALVATSAGGMVFATTPSLTVLTLLYGFWGFTTILLFWAALIRATREWGGIDAQGKAYGLLDGGRGLFVALLASISVWIFSLILPEEVESATLIQRSNALIQVIWIYTGLILGVALLVWLVVPESISIQKSEKKLIPLTGIKELFNKPAIWLQAVIVICAYVGYKTTDDFSLYASDAFNYHDVAAAKIGTVSFWVRPFAAVGAGFLADKFSASKMSLISFGLVVIGSAAIAFGILRPNMYLALILVIVTTSMGIYALRGIYFALFQESNIHLAITGSAVGLVSFIGFTPDIFMGPLMGFLIDRSPGALGHQHVFLVLSLFSLVGLTAVFLFRKSVSGNN